MVKIFLEFSGFGREYLRVWFEKSSPPRPEDTKKFLDRITRLARFFLCEVGRERVECEWVRWICCWLVLGACFFLTKPCTLLLYPDFKNGRGGK